MRGSGLEAIGDWGLGVGIGVVRGEEGCGKGGVTLPLSLCVSVSVCVSLSPSQSVCPVSPVCAGSFSERVYNPWQAPKEARSGAGGLVGWGGSAI